MVETTSLREEKPNLSAKDRLCLNLTISALPPPQFEQLIHALNPPEGVISPANAPQGIRSTELLKWLEGPGGRGLTALDEVLQVLIPKATRTAPQPVAFVMMGQMGDLLPNELEAIAELLRQKTGDPSISLVFSKEGSIKLILNGSPEGLAKLQEMFDSGELEQLDIPPVEAVTPIASNSQDARKARLIQALRLSCERVNLDRAIDLARTLTYTLDLARDRALARDQDIDRALERAFNRAIDLARDLEITRDRDRDLDLDRVRVRDPDFDRARDLERARTLAIARDLARDLDLDLAHALAVARDLVLDLDRARALAVALDLDQTLDRVLNRDLDRTLARTLERALDLDFSSANLSGANLRDLSLVGANLTDTDLTNADVTRTRFGNNSGLSNSDKRYLQSRGAIFIDPPSSDVPALVLR